MAPSARQSIELFQLVFLRALVAKGADKALIALKGGCNLRFYFGSVRYSEDIDFDAVVIAKQTLQNKVERLLRSPLVTAPLRAHGIEIVETSAPKQTDTTQRWKVGLHLRDLDLPLRTKVEFSRRDSIEGSAFESIGRDVLRPHGLTQVLATHYKARAAIVQKIHALAGRTEPQARDIFDLALLFAHPEVAVLALARSEKRWLGDAVERAVDVSFDDYRSGVVSYLAADQAALYERRSAWDAMQTAVVARLQALQ